MEKKHCLEKPIKIVTLHGGGGEDWSGLYGRYSVILCVAGWLSL